MIYKDRKRLRGRERDLFVLDYQSLMQKRKNNKKRERDSDREREGEGKKKHSINEYLTKKK